MCSLQFFDFCNNSLESRDKPRDEETSEESDVEVINNINVIVVNSKYCDFYLYYCDYDLDQEASTCFHAFTLSRFHA